MIRKDLSSYTYYDILQIPSYAKKEDIKSAYVALVKKCHPDLFAKKSPKEKRMAELRFKLINEAYNHLKNPSTRLSYNKQIKKKNSNKITINAVNDNPRKRSKIHNIITNGWHNLTEIIWPVTQSAKKENINHG